MTLSNVSINCLKHWEEFEEIKWKFRESEMTQRVVFFKSLSIRDYCCFIQRKWIEEREMILRIQGDETVLNIRK